MSNAALLADMSAAVQVIGSVCPTSTAVLAVGIAIITSRYITG